MTQNFNLSEKRIETCEDYRYREVDVKLFIKLLKEEFAKAIEKSYPRKDYFAICNTLKDYIDNLAGSALAGDKK